MANDIRVAVGDALKVQVLLEDEDGEEVTVGADDVLTLTIADELAGTQELSVSATGTQVLGLSGDETTALGEGLHVFDVQLTTSEGVCTVVAPDAFLVLPHAAEEVAE